MAQCLDLARLAPLTRRWVPTSALAALVRGRRVWGDCGSPSTRSYRRPCMGGWVSRRAADRGARRSGHGRCGSCLAQLGRWISDDAANKEWGRPVDWSMSPIRASTPVVFDRGPRGRSADAAFAPAADLADVVDLNAGRAAPRLGTSSRKGSTTTWRRSGGLVARHGTVPIRLPAKRPANSDPLPRSSRRSTHVVSTNGPSPTRKRSGTGRAVAHKDALWSARLRMGLLYSRQASGSRSTTR